MTFTLYPDARLALATDSLAGLSVGDALGAQFFVPGIVAAQLAAGRTPPAPWPWTDDTEMACCLVALLRGAVPGADSEAELDRDALAELFARYYEPYRGYGPGAVVILRLIREGTPWPIAAASAFDGQGSAGNGAAMRVAPLGAWHADSLARAAAQAVRAAEVTHAHPDGIAGAVAVAVAAASAAAARLGGHRPSPAHLLAAVAAATPAGHVRDGLNRAVRMSERTERSEGREGMPGQPRMSERTERSEGREGMPGQPRMSERTERSEGREGRPSRPRLVGRSVAEVAYELGSGQRAMAQDTVPFALWVAARFLDDYPAAVAACVTAGGDVDTTAAIAGGVVAAHTGVATPGGVPATWLAAREPLPAWLDPTSPEPSR